MMWLFFHRLLPGAVLGLVVYLEASAAATMDPSRANRLVKQVESPAKAGQGGAHKQAPGKTSAHKATPGKTSAHNTTPGKTSAHKQAPGKTAAKKTSATDEKTRRQARIPITGPALLARTREPDSKGLSPQGPPVEMEHLTTHAVYSLRPDIKGGRFSSRQMGALSTFLRCHHTGMRRPMDPRLISLLYTTARHYPDAKMYIVAGYRAPSVARKKGNVKSPHKRGVACDFRLEGVPVTELRDYLRSAYHHVGVGYYPNANFVHLDVGRKQDAYWIDTSSPGERARYEAPGLPGQDGPFGLEGQEGPGADAEEGPAQEGPASAK